MEIVVIGCGRLGADLAYRLHKAGHKVAVIDSSLAAFNNLPADFSGRTHEGDALSQDVLIRAGIDHADALAVVTNSDAINAVVGRVGRTVFKIPIVVVRNYDPRCRLIFEDLDLQVISSTSWGAQRIEEMLSITGIQTVFSAGNGEVELYEVVITADWHEKSVADLLPVEGCLPISVTRGGRAMLCSPNFQLLQGDVFHFSATDEGIRLFREKYSRVKEG